MADGLRQIARLPDPIGAISELKLQPSGIRVGRMRVPLGVIAIIYESRPNVTADAAGLCLKAGNACILRGGSEALHSNQAIAACVHEGLTGAGLPETAVQVIATTDRAAVGELLHMNEYVDIVVPRGGKGLIERVMRESRIPMIKHLDGVCHVFIDEHADVDMAIRIADNAKTQRLGTCNTMETLLVARGIADKVLPTLASIYREKGIELRGDDAARKIVPDMRPATEEDWYTEYLAAILAVRVVDGLDQAIEHIAQLRLAAHRRDRHRGQGARRPLPARSRFEFGDRQRLDALCRRLRIRPRRRNRHLDRQAARARPGRTRRTDVAEVGRVRPWRDQNVKA